MPGRFLVLLSAAAVSFASSIPVAAETYPKFQKQLGRVAQLWEMINWCIRNPLQGEDLAADDPRMIAMQAYVYEERP